jgi:osmotically-inducible protein OsmY
MKSNTLKLAIPVLALAISGSAVADQKYGEKAAGTRADATQKAEERLADVGMLSEKVQKKLKSDARLSKARIQTDVSGEGSVLLRGTVESNEQRMIAEDLVASIDGVNQVRNELRTPRGE